MRWDYIIIGAGSAGCALAHELAIGRPDARILVLEAGGSDRSPFIRLQAGVFRAMRTRDWRYRSQPDPTRNGASEKWVRGRVLGGTTSINSAIFARAAAADFDRWARPLGGAAPDWTTQAIAPLFRELESSDQAGPLRGHDGPMRVRTVKRCHATTEAFIQSACATGYAFNPDYNGEIQEGVAYAQLSQHRGLRCSSADAFLRPLLGTGNIKLSLNALVEKIEVKGTRAQEVWFQHRRKRHREAAKEIVLCAGSINSPKLLMLSGIGERAQLEQQGITVALDLPGVGRNLREHPLIVLVYRSRIETYNPIGGIGQKLRFAAEFLRSREGPLANIFEGVAFLKTDPAQLHPDVQLHFTPAAWSITAENKLAFTPFPAISIFLNKSHAASRGRVLLASSDPNAPPLIECRLFEEQVDLDTLTRGILMVRRILQARPMADLLAEETVPGPSISSMEAIKDYVRERASIANHSIGTCRMGTDSEAVVGPDLRVHGMENLWVADASIMPDHISGNTSATCMMIGKKLGKLLIARR